jgi:hypothetical protein
LAAITTLAPSRAARTAMAEADAARPAADEQRLAAETGHGGFTVRNHFPNSAGRFSRNAVMPSAKSVVAEQAPKLTASASSCSDNVRPGDSLNKPLGVADGHDRAGGQRLDDGGHRAVQFSRGHHAIHQAELECAARVEAFAQQHDFHGPARPDETWQRP